MSTSRQRVIFAALLTLGGASGGALATEAAHVLQLRLGQEALLHYAQSVLRVAESSAAESAAADSQFSDDHLAFCSDDEIAAMRRFVYNSAFIKDVGRVRDGHLYCTSGLGRLPEPELVPKPILSFFDPTRSSQFEVVPLHHLSLAPDSSGIGVYVRGIRVLLNPALYSSLDRPPMRATGMARDTEHQVVATVFGHPDPLSSQEVLAVRMIERAGIFYQPLCSMSYRVCVIASESRAEMLSRQTYFIPFPITTVLFTMAGAILGMAIVSSLLLYLRRQRSLDRRLRRAIRLHQITCAYQPVVDLESLAVIGAEALARWTDDTGEAISPEVFIPIAEERGFIGAITQQVVDRVLDEMRPLLTGSGFRVTVNLSTSDLGDPLFFDHLKSALTRTGVPAASLGFEITERATALHTEGQAGIARLRAAGHAVYLDDFGTGYSSLSYLHDLHADAIKIDRAFTHTVGTDSVTASVVPQIIDMACKLNLGIVAEGIETAAQAEYFRTACPGAHGQGWLFGRPVTANESRPRCRCGARPNQGNPAQNNTAGIHDSLPDFKIETRAPQGFLESGVRAEGVVSEAVKVALAD